METNQRNYPLYSSGFEHDACGIGAVVSIDGIASHAIVDDALSIVERLDHRAGKDATGEVGDGVGVLVQISHKFFSRLGLNLGGPGDYGIGMFFFPQDLLHFRYGSTGVQAVGEQQQNVLLAHAAGIQLIQTSTDGNLPVGGGLAAALDDIGNDKGNSLTRSG